jgi:hypothetical protein
MSKALRALVVLFVAALVAAACSSAPASRGAGTAAGAGPSGVSKTSTALDKGVQFAQCMRSNGVNSFPDPNASGQLTIDAIANGSGVDTSSAAFSQALNACKQLEPAGFTGSARTAQQQEAALKFAQCVRANGVADFPDPTPDGPLIDTNRIPSAATSSGMSILNAATHRCGTYAAAAGVTGGK